MLMLNMHVNGDDVMQGRIFLLTDVIARWLTGRLSYGPRENNEILFSHVKYD